MKGLAGAWYSERGSKIEITVKFDGFLEGYYYTVENDPQAVFPLVGRCDTKCFDGSRSFGFTVSWNNDYVNQHSVTSWSGQCITVEGAEVLKTNWLLTKETSQEDGWASTLVGTDTFYRTPPNKTATREIEAAFQA